MNGQSRSQPMASLQWLTALAFTSGSSWLRLATGIPEPQTCISGAPVGDEQQSMQTIDAPGFIAIIPVFGWSLAGSSLQAEDAAVDRIAAGPSLGCRLVRFAYLRKDSLRSATMYTKQVSIFVENERGRLAGVTKLLSQEGINIRALSLADMVDFGVLRLIVDDRAKCLRVLRAHDFTVQETEVIAVEVDDKPGGLHRVVEVLDREDINIE